MTQKNSVQDDNKKKAEQKRTLLIEIGWEEIPGDAFGSCPNFLWKDFFSPIVREVHARIAEFDVSSINTNHLYYFTPRRWVFLLELVAFAEAKFTDILIERENNGPKIHDDPGPGLVKAYRGFMGKHYASWREKPADKPSINDWSDEEIIEFVDKTLPKDTVKKANDYSCFCRDSKPKRPGDEFLSFVDKRESISMPLVFDPFNKKSWEKNIGNYSEKLEDFSKKIFSEIVDEDTKKILETLKNSSENDVSGGMFWGEGQGPFFRPVRNVCAMLGEECLDFELFGVKSSQKSFSHRSYSPQDSTEKPHEIMGGVEVFINSADEYFDLMKKYGVSILTGNSTKYFYSFPNEENRDFSAIKKDENKEIICLETKDIPKDFAFIEDFFPKLARNAKEVSFFIFLYSQPHSSDKWQKDWGCFSFLLIKEWLKMGKDLNVECKKISETDRFLSFYPTLLDEWKYQTFSAFYDFSLNANVGVQEIIRDFKEQVKKVRLNNFRLSDFADDFELLDFSEKKFAFEKSDFIRHLRQILLFDSFLSFDFFDPLQRLSLRFRYENPKFFAVPLPLPLRVPDELIKDVLNTQQYFPIYVRCLEMTEETRVMRAKEKKLIAEIENIETTKNQLTDYEKEKIKDWIKLKNDLKEAMAVKGKRRLFPVCLAVADTPYDVSEEIQQGHREVLRSRCEDAEFFYQNDKKSTLEEMRAGLKNIQFHPLVGNYDDVVEYMHDLADFLLEQKFFSVEKGWNEKDLHETIEYSKIDLTSEVVGEYSSLKGVMGAYYYAQKKGAIEESFYPINDTENIVAQAIYYQNFNSVHLVDKNTELNFYYFYSIFSKQEKGDSYQNEKPEKCEVGFKLTKHPGDDSLSNEQEGHEKWDFFKSMIGQNFQSSLPACFWYVNKLCEILLLFCVGIQPTGTSDPLHLRKKIRELVEMTCLKGWKIDLGDSVFRGFIDKLQKKIQSRMGIDLVKLHKLDDLKDDDKRLDVATATLNNLRKFIRPAFSFSNAFLSYFRYDVYSLGKNKDEDKEIFLKISKFFHFSKDETKVSYDTPLMAIRFYQICYLLHNHRTEFSDFLSTFFRLSKMLSVRSFGGAAGEQSGQLEQSEGEKGESMKKELHDPRQEEVYLELNDPNLLPKEVNEDLLEEEVEKNLYKKYLEIHQKLEKAKEESKKLSGKPLFSVWKEYLAVEETQDSFAKYRSFCREMREDLMDKKVRGQKNVFLFLCEYSKVLNDFLDEVRVFVERKDIRCNRLCLLNKIKQDISSCQSDVIFSNLIESKKR